MYSEAKRRVLLRRLYGAGLAVVCLMVVIAGLLKFMYFAFDDGGAVLAGLKRAAKTLVYAIYDKTQGLSIIWRYAPVPNMKQPISIANFWFLCFYLGAFIGAAVIRSGNDLARRVRKIEKQIEDELIRASVRGAVVRTREQIQDAVEVPKESIWKDVHTLYVAPVVVGVVLLFLGKVFV